MPTNDSNRPSVSAPEQLSGVSEEIGPRSKTPVPDMQVVPNGWGK
jgi:hypothetical protein